MEYCSHLWNGSAKYQTEALDSVDRRARRIIGKKSLLMGNYTAYSTDVMLPAWRFFTGYLASVFRDFITLFLRHHSSAEQRDAVNGGILMWLTYRQHARSAFLVRF
ncbi:jg24428 [Pararge aegeria aegeria]|uniref:Jg24428 protein n=1 Tax=Pararge aegeria aegeria TaxID=348720 RepID=A0A8S4S0D9_9NEOP|nr:jg24428 [Pararge aegeria aegeria]